MQITGAFLAEHAEIVDQKLRVVGGVLDSITVPRVGLYDEHGQARRASYYIVTLMQATPDDDGKPYRLKTEFVDPDRNTHLLTDNEIAFEAKYGENRFYVSQLNMAAPYGGRVALLQSIDDGEPVAIPVELRVVET